MHVAFSTNVMTALIHLKPGVLSHDGMAAAFYAAVVLGANTYQYLQPPIIQNQPSAVHWPLRAAVAL